MNRRWNGFGLAVLLVCGAPFLSPALAQEKVDFQVHVIRATTQHSKVDAKLKSVAGQLKKDFKYTGFSLEKTLRGQAAIDKAYTGKLPSNYEVNLTPKSRSKTQIEMELTVYRLAEGKKRMVNRVKLRLTPGKSWIYSGWRLSGGDRQVLAISAR